MPRPLGDKYSAVVRAGGARVVAMGVGFILTAQAARLVYAEAGPRGFGFAMLISTIQLLIPFADLGLGAPVINAVAKRDTHGGAYVYAVIVRALRLLAGVSSLITFLAVILSATGILQELGSSFLDPNPGNGTILAMAIMMIAWSFPLGLGYRILIGLEKTHLAIILGPLAQASTLAFVAVSPLLFGGAPVYLFAWPLGVLIMNGITFIVAKRALATAVPKPPDFSSRSVRISLFGTSLAMLFINIATPITLQSHRTILAALGSPAQLAEYSVAAQLQAPLVGLVVALATPLWPMYARLRVDGKGQILSLWSRASLGFLALGILLAIGFVVVEPFYTRYVTRSQDSVSTSLVTSLALLTVTLAVLYPTLMLLNEGAGIRLQAVTATAAAAVAVPLGTALVPSAGSAGPIIATVAAIIICQLVPLTWYVWRRLPSSIVRT